MKLKWLCIRLLLQKSAKPFLLAIITISLSSVFFLHSSQLNESEHFSYLPQQRRIRESQQSGQLSDKALLHPNDVGQSAYERSRRSRQYPPVEKQVYVQNYSLPFLESPLKSLNQELPISGGLREAREGNQREHSSTPKEKGGANLKSDVIALPLPRGAPAEGQNRLKGDSQPLRQEKNKTAKEVGAKNLSVLVWSNVRNLRNRTLAEKRNEKVYLSQLRKAGRVERLPSGGERLVASVTQPVKFPSSVKNLKPEDWEESYRIFYNLTYFPWLNDPNCSEYYTRFAPPGSLQTMAIASFPSSGNTWLRYLIESSSGIFTGSMYNDYTLTRKGMYGEGVIFDSGMTISQKTHGYTTGDHLHLPHAERVRHNHMEELHYQGIIIIRNPFKALISHRHLDVGGHTGYAPSSHFIGKGWKDFVLLKIKLWKEFYSDWLKAARPQDLHVVFYEELRSNILTVTEDVLKFLHLPRDQKRLECLKKHFDGNFKRKPPKNLLPNGDPYTEDLKTSIYEAIEELSEILKEKGNRSLPVSLYEMFDWETAQKLKKNN